MTPLDLRQSPPRSARAEAGGIIFLPRTIDKLRATQHGGELGVYTISGISEWMFDRLGIEDDAVAGVVETAKSDDDVVKYVLAATTPERIAAWNDYVSKRKVCDGDRARAIEVFPYLADREDVPIAIENLDEDDRRMFPSHA